jgi:rfaE bifunctional protein nucleotidyltransferase chain/domain
MIEFDKIMNFTSQSSEIEKLSKLIKAHNKKLVFTNGCFDIVHTGHLKILNQSKSCGDILFVGLNSDSSIKKLKGNDRPIVDQFDRAEILSNFRSVDFVIIFDEETPYDLIKCIEPDILVKGGDYAKNQIIGADIVEDNGGSIIIIPLVDGKSTTRIVAKMKSNTNGASM